MDCHIEKNGVFLRVEVFVCDLHETSDLCNKIFGIDMLYI